MKRIGALLLAALLAGCAHKAPPPPTPPKAAPNPLAPYTVNGRTYIPADERGYDRLGYASTYGAELEGRKTASGETFRPEAISAAHRSFPLPSYVEITSLDSGKVAIVRVNDRGPFREDRLIDLSTGAARLLGIKAGMARVRVRRIEPSAADRAALDAGRPASPRPDAPPLLLAALAVEFDRGKTIPEAGVPVPAAALRTPTTTVASLAKGGAFVQVTALATRAKAIDVAASFGGGAVIPSGKLFLVRLGPFAQPALAAQMLAQVRKRGYPKARIVHDSR